MKIINLLSIAAKNLKGKWAVLPVAGIAISMFCFCFAGAILTTVQEEKSLPYELNIASGTTNLSDSIIAKISANPNVTAATPILEVPAVIKTGEYSAQLTLTGIDAAYIETSVSEGSFFPDDSIMPYIVLNEAACKMFANDEKIADDEVPEIYWLGTGFYVQMGEDEKAIASKVCGILSDDEETEEEQRSAAYVSLSIAKELLRQNGQETDYTGVNVRVKNIGSANSVSKAIAVLGLTVTNSTEELQSGWDADNKEMTYLIVIGAFGLMCASILLIAWRQNTLLKQRMAWEAMRWMGLKASDMRKLFAIQAILLSILGIALGLLVALSLPSFLLTGEMETTNFMLSISFKSVFVSVVICIAAGLIPIFGKRKQIKN